LRLVARLGRDGRGCVRAMEIGVWGFLTGVEEGRLVVCGFCLFPFVYSGWEDDGGLYCLMEESGGNGLFS
jgi:hypothetical protein